MRGEDQPMMDTCGRCEEDFLNGDKAVCCSTCQLKFHIDCAHVSQAKFDILCEEDTDLFWYCRACKRTTANMIHTLAHLELRMKAIETERAAEKEELAVMKKEVETLKSKVKQLKESTKSANQEELESIKHMVNQMFCELPNTDSITNRFQEIEAQLRSCLQKSTEETPTTTEYPNCLSEYHIASVSNELSERRKREKSFVVHNLPEATNDDEDMKQIEEVIKEITQLEIKHTVDYNETSKPRMYRLGRKKIGRTRTVKIHVKSAEVCEDILSNTRRLSTSERYSSVVIQKDLTKLEQKQLKRLVLEKKRRNSQAQAFGEEPNWTICEGLLCRKSRDD